MLQELAANSAAQMASIRSSFGIGAAGSMPASTGTAGAIASGTTASGTTADVVQNAITSGSPAGAAPPPGTKPNLLAHRPPSKRKPR